MAVQGHLGGHLFWDQWKADEGLRVLLALSLKFPKIKPVKTLKTVAVGNTTVD